MSQFESKTDLNNRVLMISFKGDVTGAEQLPVPNVEGAEKVIIDLDKAAYINSSGVRNWMVWAIAVGKLAREVTVELHKIRPVFVRTQRAIRDFMPMGSKVVSAYVPYFCEACRENHEVIYNSGQDFGPHIAEAQLAEKIEYSTCPKCQGTMEIDELAEAYLKLFRSQAG